MIDGTTSENIVKHFVTSVEDSLKKNCHLDTLFLGYALIRDLQKAGFGVYQKDHIEIEYGLQYIYSGRIIWYPNCSEEEVREYTNPHLYNLVYRIVNKDYRIEV